VRHLRCVASRGLSDAVRGTDVLVWRGDGIPFGSGDGSGRGESGHGGTHGRRGALRIVRRPLCTIIAHGFGVWPLHLFGNAGVVALRVGPVAPYIGGGPSFGYDAFSGDQRNTGHGDPVAFLHELGLRQHATVTRPKGHRDTRL
jgi:hypothetical protein